MNTHAHTQQHTHVRRGGPAAARRGSILVLVVGVVALMAIIVVVYASVGQGDRRRAEALSKAAKLGDQSAAVGDYLAGVVARGAFKTQAEQRVPATPPLPPVRVRVAADYPSIDSSLVFDPTDTANSGITDTNLQRALRYSPSGSVEAVWDTGSGQTTGPDPRFPFDAFLAANQPSNLRFKGDPTSIDPAIKDKPYVADRDWRMISNASPDGRFVNLATIRNNFNAVSGVGLANNAQTFDINNNKPRTTYDLTLLDDLDVPGLTTPLPTLAINAAVRPWVYDDASKQLQQSRVNVNEANKPGKYFPADFTANQVGMFIPLADTRLGTDARINSLPRLYTEPKPANLSPGDQEYLPNQYASADGSGMIDSRWFELVDASVPNAPARSLIQTDPNLRLFVATRIVDLSAKVNVNTATSFASEPDALNPAGATPADIDLERLLTMRGAYSEAMPVSNPGNSNPMPVAGYGPGYQDMAQPSGPPVTWPNGRQIGDYNAYASAGASSSVPGFTAVGSSAYAALLDTLVRGTQSATAIPPAPYWGSDEVPNKDTGTYPPGFIRPFQYGVDSSNQAIMFFKEATVGERLRAADRRFLFSRGSGAGAELASSGSALRSWLANAPNRPTLDAGGQFGLADELELRARERVNDPRRRSRLEETLSGRNAEFPRFSPLRDDRSLELESLARDRTTSAYIPGGPAGPDVVQPDGKPDPSAYLQAKVDIRQHLTTVSGARPLASTVLAAGAEKKLSAGELKIDVNAALADIQRAAQQVDAGKKPAPNWALMQQGIDAIYAGAVDVLLPYARENDNKDLDKGTRIAWDSSGSTAGAAGLTLNYAGGRNASGAMPGVPVANNSAEVALRAAAHWTANLIASRQTFRRGVNANDPPEAADRPVMFAVPLGGQFATEKTDYARKIMFGGPSNSSPVVDVVPFGATDNLNDFPAAFAAQVFTGVTAGGAKGPRVAGRLDADAGIPVGTPSWPVPTNPPTPNPTLDQRLAPRLAGDPTGRPANMSTSGLTVFGITPQPFITQAGLISMYAAKKVTDADPCNTVNGYKLKIGGPPEASNPSYLFEAMSVQLHNPFDCEIALGGCREEDPPTGRVVPRAADETMKPEDLTYYIEFGGRIYGLAKYNDQSGTMVAPGVLRPGESRTFYFVDQTFAEISQRFIAADPVYQGDQTAVKTLVEGQFYDAANVGTATRLPPLDYATMQVRTSLPKLGLAGPNRGTDDALPSGDADKDRVVRLWRVQRNALAGDPLARSHDILVDRLRDPETRARSTFNRQFKNEGYVCIQVASVDTPDYGPAMLFWGSVRRPADTAADKGVLPLYCVESKSVSLTDGSVSEAYRRKTVNQSLNARFADEHAEPQGSFLWILDQVEIPESSLTANAIAPGDPQTLRRPVAAKLAPLVSALESFRMSPTPLRVIPDADAKPAAFNTTTTVGPPGTYTNADVPLLPAAAAVDVKYKPAGGLISEDRLTLPMMLPVPTDPTRLGQEPGPIGSAVPATPLTPMQLLTVPAFGPYNDPEALMGSVGPLADYTDKVQLNVQWTTLAEAAALAMGFDAADKPTSPEYGFAGLRDTGGAVEVEPVLKRGRLRTDAFFPFLDKQAGGRVFDGKESLPRNQRVPLALGLLDRFSTLSRTGTLTRSTPGVVNINTAPLEVLRLLPMLSPDFAPGFGTYYKDETAGAWPAHAAFLALGSPGTPWFDPAVEPWDIAAMVAAYRDKSAVRIRPLADPATGLPTTEATGTLTPSFANFRDDSVQTTPTVVPNAPAARPAGRAVWTQHPLARETPGFVSVGELLAVRYGLDAPVSGGGGVVGPLALAGAAQLPLQSSSMDRFAKADVVNQRATPMLTAPRGVDHLASDAGNRAISGFGTTSVRLASAGAGLTRGVLVPPLADRDTAIADAVANTVSVRSDLFCVWFVLHGYQPKDVEGLRPTDPMTPSVARRFVMVVDRSNVVTLGQKPRILMLEEVPYN